MLLLGLILVAVSTSSSAPALIDDNSKLAAIFPPKQPEDAAIDREAAERFVRAAEVSRSDVLIVIKDDHLIIDRRFGKAGPIELMSVTKSVTSLAVGLLLDEGKLESLDTPIHRWFPKWKKGDHALITVRHLLTQTSGLEHEGYAAPLYQATNALTVPLGRKIKTQPGLTFSYNNESTQLLSKIVDKSAGQPIDRYLDTKIFRPLAFERFTWARDKAGNVRTFSDLALEPADLAKLGQLLLHKGAWKDAQLISKKWVDESTRPVPNIDHYGYLWWIRRPDPAVVQTSAALSRLERAGFLASKKLQALEYRTFDNEAAYWLEAGPNISAEERTMLAGLSARGISPFVKTARPPIAYYADGWLGQFLVVYPELEMVVVRLRRSTENNDDSENKRWGFADLFAFAEGLSNTKPKQESPSTIASTSRTTISKLHLIELMQDLAPRPEAARIIPHFAAGHLAGWRLFTLKEDGAFYAIGLRNGDVVLKANGVPIVEPAQLHRMLEDLVQPRRTLTLEIERNKKIQSIAIVLQPDR